MKLGYYPGCSLTGTAKEFDISLRNVLKELGTEIQEIDDWSCCGASSAHIMSHLLSVALPTRNLILAKKQGLEEILAPCAACYNRLLMAQIDLKKDEKFKNKVEEIIEEKYSDGQKIYNLIELFQKISPEKIKEKRKIDLSYLNVACYYGCLLLRPNEIAEFDDREQPESFEKIVEATGAKTVKWNFKTECCGASHSIAETKIVERLSKKIIDDAVKHGANIIVVACPMCHSNLDMRQNNIKKSYADHKEIPIVYLSELIGYSLGLGIKELGLDLHFIDPVPTIKNTKMEGVPA